MTDFYFLHLLDRDDAPVAVGTDDPDRDASLAEPGLVSRWEPPKLEVRNADVVDYLANNVGLRLCSSRLRGVLDGHGAAEDGVQWLDVWVTDQSGSRHAYYALHLTTYSEVLNQQRTIRARGGFVVRPVLDREQARRFRIFAFPGAKTRLVIADSVRQAIQASGCTGVDFALVPTV